MFDCPYCHHMFATKQRLISHLSRNNKCYDVKTVGVPAVLLELMGFNGNSEPPAVSVSDPPAVNVREPPAVSVSEPPAVNVSEPPATTNQDIKKNLCQLCQKTFATPKNLERHAEVCKMRRKDPILDGDELPLIFKSKAENKKVTKTHQIT